jgi:hypothetical protein
MEMLFLHSVSPRYHDLFRNQTERFREHNPEAFYSMESLAKIIGMETWQTLLVNSIVDFSSFCTSVIARMENGTVLHARNLDFDFPDRMVKLVYKALIKKGGVIVAEAPAIAGYIGFYTGLKYNTFTVSYNVRLLRTNMSDILENIDREFEAGVTPTAQLIQKALLESHSYSEAVETLTFKNINTPCYIIVGGKQPEEGIVITRDPYGVNQTQTLSETHWYVAQTNIDFWRRTDPRYNATVSSLETLTQKNVSPISLVTDVLHQPGVLQTITIFTATMSSSLDFLDIYLIERPSAII